MRTAAVLIGLLLAPPAFAGTSALEGGDARALFERMKALEGEWVAVGESGKPRDEVQLVYRVVPGGHSLLSTEFPVSDHEMVTVYHLEGEGVAMTHYCALGNRPNMVARSFADATAVFECKEGGELDKAKAKHVHHGTLRFVGKDELRSEWLLHDGGEAVYTAEFHLLRRRDF